MSIKNRIIVGVSLLLFIAAVILSSLLLPQTSESKQPKDTNVYLGEEVRFAKDVYISVVGINVNKRQNSESQESQYELNLEVRIDQRAEKKPDGITIKSEMFSLKSVNLKSKSKMIIFFETLAQKTLEASFELVITGEIDILEDTASLAFDYATNVVENIDTDTKFKPIKAKNQFESFKPKSADGPQTVKLSFLLSEAELQSENSIVLAIDAWNHIERRIFLIARPNI